MTVFSWIVIASLVGGMLSVLCAALFALNTRANWIGGLVSYAIGALLGAVFLDILPEAIRLSPNSTTVSATVLGGILLFLFWKNWCCGGTVITNIAKCMNRSNRLVTITDAVAR